MDNIKVSVLIYVLNDVSHIEACINSVINQSLKEIEILMIDGGSTDGTLEILKKFSEKDNRVRLINCASGVGLQFNTGLKAARGKYIGICESDDYLAADMYERQYVAAEKNQLDVLKANVNRFCQLDNKEIIFPYAFSRDDAIYDRVLYPQNDMTFIKLGVNGFWSGLYRRDFLMKQNIYMNETKGASYQDISISFLAATKAERAMVMKEAFYHYRMDNPNSSINNPNKISILIEEYKLLRQRLCQEGLFEKYQEVYFAWKISGHLWFYDNLSKEMKQIYVPLMYQDLMEELEQNQFRGSELSAEEKSILEKSRQSEQTLKSYLEQSDAVKEEAGERLSKISDESNIVIFSSGNLGEIVHQYLNALGKQVVAFADNNQKLWGSMKNQLLILEPKAACAKYPDAIYVVANAFYYREIMEQLREADIRKENIVVCNSYDFFLKKVLILALKERTEADD